MHPKKSFLLHVFFWGGIRTLFDEKSDREKGRIKTVYTKNGRAKPMFLENTVEFDRRMGCASSFSIRKGQLGVEFFRIPEIINMAYMVRAFCFSSSKQFVDTLIFIHRERVEDRCRPLMPWWWYISSSINRWRKLGAPRMTACAFQFGRPNDGHTWLYHRTKLANPSVPYQKNADN